MKRKERCKMQERTQQAIKRGVRIGLSELAGQLLKLNDPTATEACGLILLASARLLRDEANAVMEAAAIDEYHQWLRSRMAVRR